MSLELARAALSAQPFNDVVGAELTTFAPGEAVLEIEIARRHLQQFGVVHGGVLAYAADNALTFAAGTVLGPNLLTGGMSITYVQAAREGTLRAHAKVAHHSARQAVCTVEVTAETPDGNPTLCAIAQGTVRTIQAATGTTGSS